MLHRLFNKRKVSALLGLSLLLVGISVQTLAPKPVFAAPVEVTADAPFTAWIAKNEIQDKAKMSLGGSIFMYLLNLMTFAADRLAYDAATMIASGGPAEEPLYNGTPVQDYFREYGAAVAGESIGLLQEDLEQSNGRLGAIFSGFNLCQPRASVTIALNLGIKSAYERPEPKCDFKAVANNWDGFIADIQDEGTDANNKNRMILTQLADSFDPQTNEFAVGVELQSSIFNRALQDSFFKANVKIKEGGFQPVTDFITGNEETPASLVDHTWTQAYDGKMSVGNEALLALVGNTDALLQVGIHAGSVFTNTLLSELTQKIYTGLFETDFADIDPFAGIDTLARGNASTARDQYRSLLAFTPIEVTNYSILAEFNSCPSTGRGLYNCVADGSFISAVGRAEAGVPMTLAEAVDQGLINGNWPLIPSADLARDQDPFCYTYGFCHGNLVKLRKARIISVGWELAAESRYNTTSDTVTLKEVMDGFDECNEAGEIDANHPWCKLIDPNWVLKYPETQCKALVNGQLLVAPGSTERQQECVDMPSCIGENDDGTCSGGYGYCVKEANIWRFRGESCPAQYASCLTFKGEETTASYLQTTIDYSNCSADNAGCLWYATEKEADNAGNYDWQPINNIANADAAADAYTSRIYFTNAVEECDEQNGSCATVIERDDTVRLNMIRNPGFESDLNTDSVPDGWTRTSSAVSIDTSGVQRTGSAAMSLTAAQALRQPGLVVSQGRFYTMSFYARQKTAGATSDVTAELTFLADIQGNDIDLNGTSFVAGVDATCTIADSLDLTNGNGLGDVLTISSTPGDDYRRYSCTFTSPRVIDANAAIFVVLGLSGNVIVDDVQLEQGENASNYHVGYSTLDITSKTVKVPPAYLGCTGSANDPAECANYASVCSENDVGCTAYTPTNGDPTVTGVASELDACPAVCVGYDTFKQEPTRYEPAGDFPVYFIPETGESCSEEDVGCDEFTNLTTEEREYYTYLRACLTPVQAATNTNGDQSATFYTWEGSDLEGYQLRTWQLLESNMPTTPYTYVSGGVDTTPHLAPCSVWTTTTNGIVCADQLDSNGDLKKDWDTALCDDHDDIFSNPDCREFYDTNGGIHYRQWSRTVTVNDACVAFRKTEIAGGDVAERTENCTNSGGFFDAATGSCRYNGFEDESVKCSESANGCRSYTGGRSRNSRVVFEDTLETGNINAWDVENASFLTYSNESLATGGHSLAATDVFGAFLYDHGSVCATPGGCAGSAYALGGTCLVEEGERYCGILHDQLFAGKTYTISFWAKGSGTLGAGFDFNAVADDSEVDASFGTVALTSGWQQFTLGPLNMTAAQYADFGEGSNLVFDPSSLAYIDNITLREGEDNITLIKDSWVTPAACDQAPTGAVSPQYYLGCQEYRTQENDIAYLKSFSRLCGADKVGCEDFYATHESDSPYAQVYQATCSNPSGAAVQSPTSCYYGLDSTGTAFDTATQYLCTIGIGLTSCDFNLDWYESQDVLPAHLTYGPSTVVVPADSDLFLVVNDGVTCGASVAGCTELGKPTWSQDRNSTTGATSVYLVNDPDQYATTLCSAGELFCAAWDTTGQGTYYFKDPGQQTCEYRTDVQVNGSEYDGWFRTGTDEFCYGTCTGTGNSCSSEADCSGANNVCDTKDPSYLIGGTESGVWRNGDAAYGGWAGQCTPEYSTCSEFQDPLDLQTSEIYQLADGKSYYYLNNENLDENVLPSSQQCDGRVSLKEGCGLFNDTSVPTQTYNASASEMSSTHADALYGRSPYSLVEPIDCENGNSVITLSNGTTVDLCAQRCIYDQGLINDITDGDNRAKKLDSEVTANDPDRYGFNKLYEVGTSCYQVSDCGTMRSQSGQEIEALDCATDARVTRAAASTTGQEERTTVPRLENDTNTVLKVNRDRECSEWLSCAQEQSTWDERTGAWKTVCSDLVMCNEYSSTIGGSSFCSSISDDEAEVVLTADVYTARDTSWYGQEYSGYAIPDLFPVQTLEQANIAPPTGYCNLLDAYQNGEVTEQQFNNLHGQACAAQADCGAAGTNYCVEVEEQDYRLALVAGTCTGDYGSSCSVGFCENTGAACSATADCGLDGGTCVAGSCQEQTATLCTTDSACSGDQICSGGTCVTQGENVSIEDFNAHPNNPNLACSGNQIFASHIDLKTGSCIREQCILTPDGRTFDVADSEGKICRAQPEVTSPFADDLVERWYDPDANNGAGAARQAGEGYSEGETDRRGVTRPSDDLVYQTRSGFENANFCNPGEECACTYRKLTFGDAGAVRYWDQDTDVPDNLGVCTAGKVDVSCNANSDCDTFTGQNSNNDGICASLTREDVLLGLEGYCLERDTSININGDREQGACLTWLPVDQLAGSTDLYAKFSEAGYFEDTYACTNTVPMANLMMSDHPAPTDPIRAGSDQIACAELHGVGGDVGKEDAYSGTTAQTCAENVTCPAGYWALMGMPSFKDGGNDDTMSRVCAESGTNSCPYVCIPNDATIPDTDGELQSCNADSAYVAAIIADIEEGINAGQPPRTVDLDFDFNLPNNVEMIGAPVDGYDEAEATPIYQSFDALVAALSACSTKGVEVTSALDSSVLHFASTDGSEIDQNNDGLILAGERYVGFTYRDLHLNAEFYPGCRDLVKVVDSRKYEGYAWTDRLLGPKASNNFTVSASQAGLGFSKLTNPAPFGFTTTSPDDLLTDDALKAWPLPVATCEENATGDLTQPKGNAPYNDCAPSASEYTDTSGSIAQEPSEQLKELTRPSSALARALISFRYEDGQKTDRALWNSHLGGIDEVFDIVNQLFAGVTLPGTPNNKFQWNRQDDAWPNTELAYDAESLSLVEKANDVREDGNPPKVWSLLQGSCIGTECEEGDLNSLTLNDQNLGNQVGVEFFRAYLKFYAAADKNQLPIRRVIIDWGDGADTTGTGGDDSKPLTNFQGSDAEDNFYKNHRGLESGTSNSICTTDDAANEWGETPASCDPNYFSYSHVYICRPEILASSRKCEYQPGTGTVTNSPCWDDDGAGTTEARYCVFQPRVHIRDNWGWCTGTCNAVGDAGCYEGLDHDSLARPDDPQSECGYSTSPTRSVGGSIDPWVYYDGSVIVKPQ